MVALFKIVRLKRGVILMAQRTALIAVTLTTILIFSPIIGYGEETSATLTVEQQMHEEELELEALAPDDSAKPVSGKTFGERWGETWQKYAVKPAAKAKAGLSDFGGAIIGTDVRLKRKTARIKLLEAKVHYLEGQVVEREFVYGLDLSKAKSCIGDTLIFLDGLQEK